MIYAYVKDLQAGDGENAFHSLMELPHKTLPDLIAPYRTATDFERRRSFYGVREDVPPRDSG